MKLKYKHYVLLMILLLIIVCIVAIGLGAVKVPFDRVVKIILSNIGFKFEKDWSIVEYNIVMYLRLPRILLGALVGGSLAIIGVVMQALIRNKLADPFILGVSSGASVFATLGMLFGTFSVFGVYSLPLSAFIGSAITITFVYTISRNRGKIEITQLLLSGVAVSMMMEGVTRFIVLSAPNALGLHNATFWMSGSLASAKWSYLMLPAVILLICLIILMINYRSLNILLFGEETATTLGISVTKIQKLLIFIASLMSGVVISVSGTIGFVGLMVPHFSRMIIGSNHKKVLPFSLIIGAVLVVFVDIIARVAIAPEELPVGILTAIIGGPIFIYLLRKENRKG